MLFHLFDLNYSFPLAHHSDTIDCRILSFYVLGDMKQCVRKFRIIVCPVRALPLTACVPAELSMCHLIDLSLAAMKINSVEEIKLRLDQVKVVAVTCLGITNPLLVNKRFDVCIMDEAGQTTLPVCSLIC